jgi:hypothetical protein
METKFWVRKEKHKKAKRTFKLARGLLLTAGIILSLLIPVMAQPPDILQPQAGWTQLSDQPFLEFTPTGGVATQWNCCIADQPMNPPPAPPPAYCNDTLFQVATPVADTMGQVAFTNVTAGYEGLWFIACEYNDGVSWTGLGNPSFFTYPYSLGGSCQTSDSGVFTGQPDANYQVFDPNTPLERTIYEKKTGFSHQVGSIGNNITNIELIVEYNDSVFWVNDTYDLTGITTTDGVTRNEFEYVSPVDSTAQGFPHKYNATYVVYTDNFPNGTCNITYQYAVDINPDLNSDTGAIQSNALLGGIFLLIAFLWFIGGKRG